MSGSWYLSLLNAVCFFIHYKNNRFNPAKKARMTNLIQEKSKNYWLKPNQIKTQLMNKETNAFNNEKYQEPDIYQVNVRKPIFLFFIFI
jgi:hypothetical protein